MAGNKQRQLHVSDLSNIPNLMLRDASATHAHILIQNAFLLISAIRGCIYENRDHYGNNLFYKEYRLRVISVCLNRCNNLCVVNILKNNLKSGFSPAV